MSANAHLWWEDDEDWSWSLIEGLGEGAPTTVVTSPPRLLPERPDWIRLKGRLTELSSLSGVGLASMGLAFMHAAQVDGFWPVWISTQAFPFVEDVLAAGLDVRSLIAIRVPDVGSALRAAEHVMRSGVCGAVCLDLGAVDVAPTPMTGRLMRLAQQHEQVCVFLTRREAETPSLSPLVACRLKVDLEATAMELFAPLAKVKMRTLRDKRYGVRSEQLLQTQVPAGIWEQESWA